MYFLASRIHIRCGMIHFARDMPKFVHVFQALSRGFRDQLEIVSVAEKVVVTFAKESAGTMRACGG
jgi:hypothetical protein